MALRDKKPFKKNNVEKNILSFMFGVVFSAPVIAITAAVFMIVSTVIASTAVVTGANLVAGGAVIIGSAGGMTILALDVVNSLCGELELKKVQSGVLFGVIAAMGLAFGIAFGNGFERSIDPHDSAHNDISTIETVNYREQGPIKMAQNITPSFNISHIKEGKIVFEYPYKGFHKAPLDRIAPHIKLDL